MPISKDEHYEVYNFGIAEGREIVKSYLSDEDVLDVALEAFDNKTARLIEDEELEELIKLIQNFHDGVEDGIKSQIGKECDLYVKWMRKNL